MMNWAKLMLLEKVKFQPIFDYIRCPLHKYTFDVKVVRQWVEKNCEGYTLNLFAGMTRLTINEIRNDLDMKVPADYHMDALQFVRQWEQTKFDTIILDPPYSYRKSMEKYEGRISSPFNLLKNELIKIIKFHGKIITFGYHSISMGRKRGFITERIALFSHGGAIHDTIVSVERKIFKGE